MKRERPRERVVVELSYMFEEGVNCWDEGHVVEGLPT